MFMFIICVGIIFISLIIILYIIIRKKSVSEQKGKVFGRERITIGDYINYAIPKSKSGEYNIETNAGSVTINYMTFTKQMSLSPILKEPYTYYHIGADSIDEAKEIREKYFPPFSLIPAYTYFQVWTSEDDVIGRDCKIDYEDIVSKADKPKQVMDCKLPVEVPVEEIMVKHLSRMEEKYSSWRPIENIKKHWDKLLESKIKSFSIKAIDEELHESVNDWQHHYQAKNFGDIYLAVSTIFVPQLFLAYKAFDNGYLSFLNTLLTESNYKMGDIDLAHWTYSTDGQSQNIQLTFLPSMKLMQSSMALIQSQNDLFFFVFASDLMTPEEKSSIEFGFVA